MFGSARGELASQQALVFLDAARDFPMEAAHTRKSSTVVSLEVMRGKAQTFKREK